jgi:hypothetical protein
MKKIILVPVALIVILLIGYYFFLSQKNADLTSMTTSSEAIPVNGKNYQFKGLVTAVGTAKFDSKLFDLYQVNVTDQMAGVVPLIVTVMATSSAYDMPVGTKNVFYTVYNSKIGTYSILVAARIVPPSSDQ